MALSEPEGGLDWQDHGTRGVLLGDRCSLCDQMENVGRENRAGKLKNLDLTRLCFSARGL